MDIEYEKWIKLCYVESVRIVSKMFNIEYDSELTDYCKNIQIEIFKDLIKKYDKKIVIK